MAALPRDMRPYRRTPTFTEETVPAGLTGRHSTKAGVWGVITVEAGRLFLFRLSGDGSDSELLVPGEPVVGAPDEPHRVEADGPVAFHVVFHRAESAQPDRAESTPTDRAESAPFERAERAETDRA